MTQAKSNIFHVSDELLKFAIENPSACITCSDLHGDSCFFKFIKQFFDSAKGVYKIYLFVHLIPFLIFKRKKLFKKPKKQLTEFIKGFVFSLLFAGGYASLVRGIFCLVQRVYKCTGTPMCILGGFFGGASLLFEPVSRQSQIALFTVNKSAQTFYNLCKRRGYPVTLPKGECVLMALCIAVLCFHYLQNRQIIKKSYLTVLDKILGEDI